MTKTRKEAYLAQVELQPKPILGPPDDFDWWMSANKGRIQVGDCSKDESGLSRNDRYFVDEQALTVDTNYLHGISHRVVTTTEVIANELNSYLEQRWNLLKAIRE